MRSHAPIAATAALLLLALTGCTSTPATTAGESTAPATSAPADASPSPTATADAAQPLTAEPAPPASDKEATFLFEVRKRADVAVIVKATDEQLLAAGRKACEALATNPDLQALRLIEGETPRDDGRYFDSTVIGKHAQMYMCPETETSVAE